jgi:hypothetical protein
MCGGFSTSVYVTAPQLGRFGVKKIDPSDVDFQKVKKRHIFIGIPAD